MNYSLKIIEKIILPKINKCLPIIILLALSLWSIFPIIQNPTNSYFNTGDDGLITWQINQTIQKIPNKLGNIFETNIFYPYKHTLAYTNLAVPSALIGYLPVKLTGSPLAAYNFVIILTQLLSATFLYLLFKKLTNNSWASLIGTLSFLLSKYHMQSIAHIHVFMMHWWLISIYFLWLYKDKKKIRYLYLASLFFVIQTWESFYQAFWIILIGSVLLIPEIKKIKEHISHFIYIFVAVLFFISPILITYISISRQFGSLTTIRTASHFSMSFNDIWGSNFSLGAYANFFISIIILRKKLVSDKKLIIPNILYFSGIILSLGPVLKWSGETIKLFGNFFIPLPYTFFYYLIPGFSALRSVDRFFGIAYFAIALFIAYSLASLKKSTRSWIFLLTIFLAIYGGKTVQKTYDFPKTDDYPKVYSWLADQPGKVILEYPIYTWIDDKYSLEMYRMVYSLKHTKFLIGGASGFIPPERLQLLDSIKKDFPNKNLNEKLRDIDVNYILLHKNEVDITSVNNFESDFSLKKVYDDPSTSVYTYK